MHFIQFIMLNDKIQREKGEPQEERVNLQTKRECDTIWSLTIIQSLDKQRRLINIERESNHTESSTP